MIQALALKKIKKNPLQLVAVFLLIASTVYYFINSMFSKKNTEFDNYLNNVDEEQLTISDAQAKGISDELWQSMRGFGTDEERIYKAVTGLTKDDFKKVIKAFGLRKYDDEFGGESFPGLGWLDKEEDLIYWLKAELSQEEFKKLNYLISKE